MTEFDDENKKFYLRGKRHLAVAFSKLFCQSETLFKCYQIDSTAKDKCQACRMMETALEESDNIQ
jgi:hypothetical protein